MGRQVLDEIKAVFVGVTLIYQLVGFIRSYSANFNQCRWKDATRARQLLNQGQQMINDGPDVDTLHPLVCSVIDLIDEPEGKKPKL